MKIRITGISRFRRFLEAKRYLYLLLIAVAAAAAYPLVADFYTKGEPREAIVAQAMMEEGEYILPRVYGDEAAFKPPMFHWLEILSTVFTGGEVTPLSARLPSAVALFVIAGATFFFFSQRRPLSPALLAALVFITTLDPHRFGIIARVDMVLTMFIILALFGLYAWDEKRGRKGIPWSVVLFLSCGVLTKGPVGVVLPLLIFLVFAVIRRYPLGPLVLKLLLIALAASVLPAIWYAAAFHKGGEPFFRMVWNENVLRFLGIADNTLFYDLGHEGKFFKPLIYFILGLVPWTLLLFFLRWGKKETYRLPVESSPLHLFALVAAVTTLVFYMFPMSKSSSYLLPMYPFAALGIAETLYAFVRGEHKRLVGFSLLMCGIGVVMLAAMIYLQTGLRVPFVDADKVEVFGEGLRRYPGLALTGELLLVVGVLTILYQILRKNYHKLAFSVVFLVFIVHFNIDVPAMKHYKEVNSARPFAEKVREEVGDESLYVVSDLNDGIYNLYGLAFYAKKRPVELRTADPREGYLVIWERDFERLKGDALSGYDIELVDRDPRSIKEGGHALLLFVRKVSPRR